MSEQGQELLGVLELTGGETFVVTDAQELGERADFLIERLRSADRRERMHRDGLSETDIDDALGAYPYVSGRQEPERNIVALEVSRATQPAQPVGATADGALFTDASMAGVLTGVHGELPGAPYRVIEINTTPAYWGTDRTAEDLALRTALIASATIGLDPGAPVDVEECASRPECVQLLAQLGFSLTDRRHQVTKRPNGSEWLLFSAPNTGAVRDRAHELLASDGDWQVFDREEWPLIQEV